ncbi:MULTISPECIES: BCCT family transporter [Staphylococcus]|nr:BCCT family transporter [Staphylococcus gallinarum]
MKQKQIKVQNIPLDYKVKKESKAKGALIDYKIFIPFICIMSTIVLVFSFFEKESFSILNSVFNTIVSSFSWGYIWYMVILFAAAMYFSFSKYGKVVLGDPVEKPRFSMFEYASILISTGVGISIMRTGSIQWIDVALNPPAGVKPESTEALLWGNSYSMFIWSPFIFTLFVTSAPAIAYILHVKKSPYLRISEACRSVLGNKITDGIGGIIIDVVFLVSILSAAAVTLGFSTPIITSSVAYIFNIEQSFGLSLVITIIWILLFTLSAYLGIEKGIKKLSTFNMYAAGAFAIFILVLGPGLFIINYFTESFSFIIKHYLDFAIPLHSMKSGNTSFMESNTIFWYAYTAIWGMLGSVFIAKVSKGRTIKEMILTYLLGTTIVSWVTTGVLGGLGVNRFLTGEVPVTDIAKKDIMAVIPQILTSLPLPLLVVIAFIFIGSVFLITTLDSTTYTLASYSSRKNMSQEDPPKSLRIILAIVLAIVTIVLMKIGGLEPLEVLSGVLGIPIIFVQFLTIYAAIKMMHKDKAWKYNIRNKENR